MICFLQFGELLDLVSLYPVEQKKKGKRTEGYLTPSLIGTLHQITEEYNLYFLYKDCFKARLLFRVNYFTFFVNIFNSKQTLALYCYRRSVPFMKPEASPSCSLMFRRANRNWKQKYAQGLSEKSEIGGEGCSQTQLCQLRCFNDYN